MKDVNCRTCNDGFSYFNGMDGKPICVPCFLHEPTAQQPIRKLPTKRVSERHTKPDHYAAHRIVMAARNSGFLKPEPCEICGEFLGVHAHHEDYSKPLEVRWLCVSHHTQVTFGKISI